jgi:hypothetical protein
MVLGDFVHAVITDDLIRIIFEISSLRPLLMQVGLEAAVA